MVGWWAPFKEQDREMEEEQYLQSLSHRKPLEGRQGFILLSWRERSGAESLLHMDTEKGTSRQG